MINIILEIINDKIKQSIKLYHTKTLLTSSYCLNFLIFSYSKYNNIIKAPVDENFQIF